MEIFEYNTLYKIGIIVIILVVINLPITWYVNYDMHKNMYRKINKESIGIGFNTIFGILLCYLLMGFSLYWYVVRSKTELLYTDSMKQAGILGLTIYGFYNTTNLATINRYSTKVAFIDTLWGGILFALTIGIFIFITNNNIINSAEGVAVVSQ